MLLHMYMAKCRCVFIDIRSHIITQDIDYKTKNGRQKNESNEESNGMERHYITRRNKMTWLAWTNEGLYRNFNLGKACPFIAGETWTKISENLLSSLNHLTYVRASFDGPLYCTKMKHISMRNQYPDAKKTKK